MKLLFSLIFTLFFGFSSLTFAADKQYIDSVVKVDLHDADINQVVHLFLGEFLEGSYIVAPDVVDDHRRISLRWSGKKSAAKAFLQSWLTGVGVGLLDDGGVVRVSRLATGKLSPDLVNLFYQPKYNSASSLQSLVAGLLGNIQASDSPSTPEPVLGALKPVLEGSSLAKSVSSFDTDAKLFVFRGTAEQKKLVEQILLAVDVPVPVISVVGVIYEVSLTKGQGSAVSLAGSILGGKLGVSFGGTAKDNYLKFEGGGLDGIVSALDRDSRFKLVSSPRLSVRSGAMARLLVGQDVPVLGAITQTATGTTQSVDYRPSGVMLELKPVVYGAVTRLSFMQQISSFVKTDTGVNGSPTMLRREARTDVDLTSGDVFVVGGLVSSNDSSGRSGLPFLPRQLDSNSQTSDSSELLVLLQITRL